MLTDSEIRESLGKDSSYKLFDSGGLYLLIRSTGHRGWRFKYRVNGHEKLISLGPYPTVSLAKARLKLRRAKALLLDGIDPSLKRKAEKYAGADSFEAVAREWYGSHECRWADSYSDHIIRRFERDIFPWIGSKQIKKVSPSEILTCLKRIEARGTRETAHRVYQNICWVFRHAAVTGRLIHDPSAPLKGKLLPTNEKHLASITDPKEFGELLRAIDAYVGSHTVRTALRLAPLVFVRHFELRAAEWSEINFDTQEWLIPAHRMKMRVPHIVPLSTQAIALLRDIQPATSAGKYVFPSPRSRTRPLSNVALLAALRRMGYEQGTVTVHGFRATASTLLNEQGFNGDWIERQLAHGERDHVRVAYNYAEYLPQRKVMMQDWADYLDELRSSSSLLSSRSRFRRRREFSVRSRRSGLLPSPDAGQSKACLWLAFRISNDAFFDPSPRPCGNFREPASQATSFPEDRGLPMAGRSWRESAEPAAGVPLGGTPPRRPSNVLAVQRNATQ